jgi:hypothetical protein
MSLEDNKFVARGRDLRREHCCFVACIVLGIALLSGFTRRLQLVLSWFCGSSPTQLLHLWSVFVSPFASVACIPLATKWGLLHGVRWRPSRRSLKRNLSAEVRLPSFPALLFALHDVAYDELSAAASTAGTQHSIGTSHAACTPSTRARSSTASPHLPARLPCLRPLASTSRPANRQHHIHTSFPAASIPARQQHSIDAPPPHLETSPRLVRSRSYIHAPRGTHAG